MNFQSISINYPLILASASPRRKTLLAQVNIPCRPLPSDVNEKEISAGPAQTSRILAEKKALDVYPRAGMNWILGADTIVTIDDYVLGKPDDDNNAKDMLILLSGREHKVITGFCVLDPLGRVAHSEEVSTIVRIKGLSNDEIDGYIRTGEPFGKAGSYAIQGIGSFLVEAISGSYSNVVGLPLCALIKSLLAVGAINTFPLQE